MSPIFHTHAKAEASIAKYLEPDDGSMPICLQLLNAIYDFKLSSNENSKHDEGWKKHLTTLLHHGYIEQDGDNRVVVRYIP